MELLVTNVTAVGSPIGAENTVFGVIFGVCWQIWATFVTRVLLCDLETPLLSPKSLLSNDCLRYNSFFGSS